VARIGERIGVMVADMKHFGAAAHASLDEKEKVEARLKRQQFDYRNELAHTEHIFESLSAELQALEEKIAAGNAAEEDFLQAQRQKAYSHVKAKRDEDSKRELRLGYLQRLHRIMGVKFTPEKPDSVQDIVKASLNHEQRNASLLHFVSVQNGQLEELEEQLRTLDAEAARLAEEQQAEAKEGITSAAATERQKHSTEAILQGIDKRDADLKRLCPLVTTLCAMTGADGMAAREDGGMLQLRGCRPDTLADHLRLVDVAIKELRQRAQALPTAIGNEWLRDFLAHKEINTPPTVTEIRKELEAAAQQQKEQKAARDVMEGTTNGDSFALNLAGAADVVATLPEQS
jgi:DNA repair exonuclease SbcCD ATPase subunit